MKNIIKCVWENNDAENNATQACIAFNILQMWNDSCFCQTHLPQPTSKWVLPPARHVCSTFRVSGSLWSATNSSSKKKKRRRKKKKEIAVTQPSREKLSTDKHGFPLLSIEFRDDQHNSEVTGGVSAGENFSHFSKKKEKGFKKKDSVDKREIENVHLQAKITMTSRCQSEKPNRKARIKGRTFYFFSFLRAAVYRLGAFHSPAK